MFQGSKKYTAQPELFPALFFSVIVLVRFQPPILKPSETLPSTLRAKLRCFWTCDLVLSAVVLVSMCTSS